MSETCQTVTNAVCIWLNLKWYLLSFSVYFALFWGQCYQVFYIKSHHLEVIFHCPILPLLIRTHCLNRPGRLKINAHWCDWIKLAWIFKTFKHLKGPLRDYILHRLTLLWIRFKLNHFQYTIKLSVITDKAIVTV